MERTRHWRNGTEDGSVGGSPWGITAGPDGNLWFCEEFSNEASTGDQFGRITPSGSIKMFRPLAGYHDLRSITTGPDGALWFTDVGAHKVGRMTTAGVATEYPCGSGTWPDDILTGPDGALWFINTDRICRMTTAGQLKEFPVGKPNTLVFGLSAGPDGALWFTELWSSPQGSRHRARLRGKDYDIGHTHAIPGNRFIRAEWQYHYRTGRRPVVRGIAIRQPGFYSQELGADDNNGWIHGILHAKRAIMY